MADYIEKKLRDEEKVGKAWGKETERGRDLLVICALPLTNG